jgi:hypothetical protein
MTDEELDMAVGHEAVRLWRESGASAFTPMTDVATTAARLAREGWMPVDPDLLAVREIVAVEWEKWCAKHQVTTHYGAKLTRSGHCDRDHSFRAALAAYKAGKAAR